MLLSEDYFVTTHSHCIKYPKKRIWRRAYALRHILFFGILSPKLEAWDGV
jgi:hypothetical protein